MIAKIVFKVLVKNAARRDLMYSDNFDVTTKQNTHITSILKVCLFVTDYSIIYR